MKPIRRAIIVDDEEDARFALRALLNAHPEVEIVGEAASVGEASQLFRSLNPNLIFLDVQMPKRNGFALLPELHPVPDIIFVTAYDCFAVQAFEVNAVDYLVKPIHPRRLALSLMRLDSPYRRRAKPFAQNDAIFLYSDREMRVVSAAEITYIEAEHNYTLVHLISHKAILVRRKISEWLRLLPAEMFWRADRFTILNLSAIRSILPLSGYCSEVHFHQSRDIAQLRLLASRRLRKIMQKSSLTNSLQEPND